jgi:TRAP-type uncharacterized transport system substrate-binding protein
MKALHQKLPFRGRVALLIGIFGFAAGAALMSYQFYRRPAVLTLAVGSSDGEARQIASIIAGRLATTNSPVRLKIENAGTEVDAARAFAAGTADLAIVRADAGNLHDGRAVVVTARGVLTIIAPPGSMITDFAKLRGHTVGVVNGDVNHGIVDVLTREYDLDRANVVFRDVAPQDARQALQSKAVSALLLVAPLTEKHLAWIKSLFRESTSSSPVLMQVDAAGAIADRKGPYESFDIPKGTLRGAPPVPGDDVTTLRVGYYLVANRHLNANMIGDLARKVMSTRRDLVGEQPLLSGIAAPDLDADAFLPVHPGAAAFFNGTQESFMDRYANVIYLTPMALGALASVFAAAWRFLGARPDEATAGMLENLCVLPARIRQAPDEAALSAIEGEIDSSLGTRLARIAGEAEHASEAAMLISAASRLDNLIYHRRAMLASGVAADPENGIAELFACDDGAVGPGRAEDGMAARHSAA